MTAGTIVHSQTFLEVCFDEEGLELRPWATVPIKLEWREVEFVCPVPAMERGPDGWREKPLSVLLPGFRSTLRTAGLLELNFVVRDRRPVLARAESWLTRHWMSSRLRPMFGANDCPCDDQSLLRLQLRRRNLDGTITQLMDLLAAHSRFDLVVDF